MVIPHILLLTFPVQGHINPALQLAKRLVGLGVQVTFATSIGAQRRMSKTMAIEGLFFASYSDGYDNGVREEDNFEHYMDSLRVNGPKSLAELIVSANNNGNPFTCVVYSILIPWVVSVAHELHLPTILLWNQPVAVLDIYYHYFHGYGDSIEKGTEDPAFSLKLPGLPPLGIHDLPSFIRFRSNHYPFALPIMKEHLDFLDQETNPTVLVNTFDELECEALKSIHKYKLLGIGPLIPSAFLDGKDPNDTSFGGDLFKGSNNYIDWLNSKSEASVIYISFGSISVLSKPQKEEMARALIDIGRPFLWVIRETDEKCDVTAMSDLNLRLEARQGMIVPWCSQVEVLSHPSVGCFVTHCGWNSTFESLASGVPVVGFPQWTDQFTNARMIEDVWKTGVRVGAAKREDDNIVGSEEIKRCLERVMEGKDMRSNAKKWKVLAMEASIEGGSSHQNLKTFVDQIKRYL